MSPEVSATTADAPATVPGAQNDLTRGPKENRRTIAGDLRVIVSEMRSSTDLLRQLTLRDIRIRYKQAALGFAWALLIPAVVVLSGLAVRFAFAYASKRPLQMDQIAGMAIKSVPWAFMVGCLNAGTQSLISNRALVSKIYFPREVLPLSSVLAQTFDSLIGLLMVAVLMPFLGVTPSAQLAWVPLLLLLLWTQAMAAALFLSCANLFFRDVKYLVQMFVSFGIFITPVIFDAQMFGPRGVRFIMLNPVAPVLEGLRLSVVHQHNLLETMRAPEGFVFWEPYHLVYAAVWAVGGLLVSSLIFHRSEGRFAELS